MGFRSVSFRLFKDFNIDSGQELTPEESTKLPLYQIFQLYIDPIVDNIHPEIKNMLGFVPSAATTTILILLILYALYLDRKEKLGLLNLYGKLPTQNQLLIKAAINAQKQRTPSSEGIFVEMQKLTNSTIDKTWFTEKLTEAKNAGLIKEALGNQNDEPIIQWVNQVPQSINFSVQLQHFFHF